MFWVEMDPSKAENTLSVFGELIVSHIVALSRQAVQRLGNSVDEHVAASVNNTVGCALQVNGDIVGSSGRVLLTRVGITNQAVELDVATERNLSRLLVLAALDDRERISDTIQTIFISAAIFLHEKWLDKFDEAGL